MPIQRQMTRPITFIAIDPDVDKSGVAVLNTANRTLSLYSLDFPSIAYELLPTYGNIPESDRSTVRVIVESGWLNSKSTWHNSNGNGAHRIAKNVGANHQVGRLIASCSRVLKLDTIEQRPLRKCWQGRDGKITHAEAVLIATNGGYYFPTRSNQEERDAFLLAWNESGLPIITQPKKQTL